MPMLADSKAVDDYIEKVDETHQTFLKQIREVIKSSLPDTVEGLAWSMPSYWQNTYLIHFQAFKKHVNVYVGLEAVIYLQDNYPELSYTKRGFQLVYGQKIPKKAIEDVCQWQLQQYGEKDET
ncbi:iron chaperone [Streptococcus thoraltensis]|uniref:iron chaperone n=1 Tax=Streptococcus thoraltensis TaxID=55085 RepID=UPI00037E05AB|nr:DUF1801 domain-containing protein [Streptococcus thoraltensis]MDY4760615.1 DUF1801 domain-containing protein [Streptococcus thoraltensis]